MLWHVVHRRMYGIGPNQGKLSGEQPDLSPSSIELFRPVQNVLARETAGRHYATCKNLCVNADLSGIEASSNGRLLRRDASGKIMWDLFLSSPVLGAFLPSGAVLPFNFTEVHQVPISEAGTAVATTPGSTSSNPLWLPNSACIVFQPMCALSSSALQCAHWFPVFLHLRVLVPAVPLQDSSCHSKMVFAMKWFW